MTVEGGGQISPTHRDEIALVFTAARRRWCSRPMTTAPVGAAYGQARWTRVPCLGHRGRAGRSLVADR